MLPNPYLRADPLPWLMGASDPSVRFLVLRDLLDRPPGDAERTAAQREAYQSGVLAGVLAAMHPDGYWAQPGSGYYPKYTGSVWALILLAQLGARMEEDERVAAGCAYILDQALTPQGQISLTGTGSGTADCLQGNLCWALTALGCADERLGLAYDWMARSVTGEGIAPATEKHAPLRYYAGKCGPLFACGSNNGQPCAWGGVKVVQALSTCPAAFRTPLVEEALRQGADFLLENHPEQAGYPNGWSEKPSGSWFKFGFPVFYVTDILQIVEALNACGLGSDPRLAGALDLVAAKQDAAGRWPLEYDYAGKTYGDFGAKKQPNPWVTLRAARALKAARPTLG